MTCESTNEMNPCGIEHTIFETPLGKIAAVASERGLRALEFCHSGRDAAGDQKGKRSTRILNATGEWLSRYFARSFGSLPSVPMDFAGTEFENRVWRALLHIGVGEIETYGHLAASIGAKGAARAVGSAVGRNPIGIIVPCHRIIGANGALTGYGGGLARKQWLLRHEGFQVLGKTRSSLVLPTTSRTH